VIAGAGYTQAQLEDGPSEARAVLHAVDAAALQPRAKSLNLQDFFGPLASALRRA
jgi:hypothetical protein